MTRLSEIEIPHYRVLDELGQLCSKTNNDALPDKAQLIDFYRGMLRTRLFDEKAIKLQRTGRLGTYASSLGQEAIGTALGAAMQTDDVLAPTYRDYAAQFSRGVSMSEVLLYWGGDERGMDYQQARQDLPICVPIASQATQAVGIAYAMFYRQQPRVCVCVIGDGGTSKGEFYEAINAAGVWQLPLVFVISNNQWAISLPRERQSAANTLAQKAVAAGLPGEQVDGNDVIACYERFSLAIEQARTGGGASVIEALSYRLSDHTTADDAARYRDTAELEKQWRYEPITRLKMFLQQQHQVCKAEFDDIRRLSQQEVEQQVQLYLDTPVAAAQSMFDFLYQDLPAALQEQRLSVREAEVDDLQQQSKARELGSG